MIYFLKNIFFQSIINRKHKRFFKLVHFLYPVKQMNKKNVRNHLMIQVTFSFELSRDILINPLFKSYSSIFNSKTEKCLKCLFRFYLNFNIRI